MQIVLDTNVLVSGLLNRRGPPGQIVDLILVERVNLIVDDRILTEYANVLARPRLMISPAEAHSTLAFIAVKSSRVNAAPLNLSPNKVLDPKDLPFAEIAVAGNAEVLVTGNAKHFAFLSDFSIKVLSPTAFIELVT